MIFKSFYCTIYLDLNGRVIKEIKSSDVVAEIVIGRNADCIWQIPSEDRGASGCHAKLYRKGKHIFIQDLGSRNGIYFMGAKIREKKLAIGDIFSIGDCKLHVEECSERGREKNLGNQYHQLEQLSGNDKGKIYRLKDDYIKIGAASSCGIILNDSLVSVLHAVIENHSDGICWIKDSGSRNGTKINGTPLTAENAETGRMLKDGDIISIAYMDFRFWDRSVTHIRSHILLKVGVIVATFALALGGYFAFQTVSPSAKSIRLQAERYASSENFDRAQEVLQTAMTARGADSDASQRQDLARKIELWRQTAATWKQIKITLGKPSSEGAMYDANDLFSELVASDREQWRWNASNAVTEMKNAQETHALLAALLGAEDRLRNMDGDMAYIKNLTQKLEENITICQAYPLDFRSGLLSCAKDLASEMKTMIKEYDEIIFLMSQYTSVADTGKIILQLNKYMTDSEERFTSRKKAGQATSQYVSVFCKNLLAPLRELENSQELLAKNYICAANFMFHDFKTSIKLPTSEQCIISTNLSMRRADMENSNRRLEKIIVQLKNFKTYFEHNEIAPSQKSELLSGVFSSTTWEQILSCDSLMQKPPQYSEKSARSKYDQYLGVYAFWEFLRSADGEFDSTIFEERFKPDLFKCKDLFNNVETFVTFCNPSARMAFYNDIKIMLAVNNGDNALKKHLDSAVYILTQRDLLANTLYQTYQGHPDTRNGIIAGGAALCLHSKSSKYDAEKLASELNKSLHILRKSLAVIVEKNKNLAPEQILINEKSLLEHGIPGDPFLKQPWTDYFGSKNKP